MEALLQAKNIIEQSQNILILPSPESQGDSLGAGIALFFTLKKLGKNVNLLIDEVPEKFQFLADLEEMPNDFVISVNTAENEVSKFRYEKDENELRIFLTPKNGPFRPLRVSFPSRQKITMGLNGEAAKKDADLAVVIGAWSMESLGGQFEREAAILSRIPILNIDNQPLNEGFGEVNLIEITSALSEITLALVEALELPGKELTDRKITTALLAGIVWSSQNFRNPKTRPKTFKIAASLIERGADHQNIIHHLYKQKKVSQIKILGRILEKLDLNEEKQLCLACLSEKDFTECQANSKDLSFAIEELKLNFRYLPNLLVLWESHASPIVIKGIFYSPSQGLVEKVLENFEGISRGNTTLFVVREDNLQRAQEKILKII